MKTQKTKAKTKVEAKTETEAPKRISKFGKAMIANYGTGKILDMRAVMK